MALSCSTALRLKMQQVATTLKSMILDRFFEITEKLSASVRVLRPVPPDPPVLSFHGDPLNVEFSAFCQLERISDQYRNYGAEPRKPFRSGLFSAFSGLQLVPAEQARIAITTGDILRRLNLYCYLAEISPDEMVLALNCLIRGIYSTGLNCLKCNIRCKSMRRV